MMFTLVPTAMAEGEKVAKVGETEYDTLAAAINAAGTGGTVKLLADITGQTVIPAEKDIVLDLNGKTMTHTGTTLYNSGKLTVRDSSADKSGKIVSTGNVGIGVNHDSTTTIEYANIEAVEGAVITGYATGAEITIQNGIFVVSDNAVIAGNGNSTDHNGAERKNANTITINGGKFTGNIKTTGYIACGIYAPWKDIVTVNGGEFTVNNGIGIVARAGQVKVNGGTFTCTGSAEGKVGDKNFDMAAAQCLYFDATDPAYPAYNSETDYIKVTGGTFSSNVSAYVADGYTYNSETKTVEPLGETNSVAKVGDTYYKTLAEAVAAADNATVTLLKDVTANVTIPEGKTITLDLNGKTLSGGKNNDKAALLNEGTVTIKDSSATKTGTIKREDDADKTGTSYYVIKNLGTMTIEQANVNNNSGYKETNSAGSMKGSSLICNGDRADGNETTLTINDGVFEQQNFLAVKNGAMGILNVNGGKFTSKHSAIQNWYKADIKGGEINGQLWTDAFTWAPNGVSAGETKISGTTKFTGEIVMDITGSVKPTLEISGGEMNVTNWRITSAAANAGAKPVITGGLFSSEPAEKYIAENHYVDASNNGDYPYTVKEGAKPAGALIVVKDKTDTAVNGDITGDDKTAINNVISKANVDGVAEAVAPAKKADIVAKSSATVAENDKVEIEVAVKVEAKAADLANGKLTFEASPVATVKVNGAATGTTVPVTNDMLNGNAITVKLPLPTGFNPEQIKHISSDGSVEYFLKTAKRGANTFEIKDGCAVFTITKFSTFELSGTVTYVEPSYYSGSSSDPTYSVTVDKTENGSVTVSPKSASKGDTVTITVKPDSGYVLETLTVTDKNGNELTLKDKGSGKYTFTMPAGKVEVKATFMEDNSVLNFFYDVPNDAYFYEAVKWAVKNGITTGVGNDLFAPEQPCTRAQIVTFLWRAAGSPEPKGTAAGMTDVVSGSYYEKAVAWAIENGITTGTTATTFSPDATCTRDQSVTFLYRALKGSASGSTNFTDVASDAFYADAVNWAVANNVTNGTSATTFSPNSDCTRAEIVTFLYRAYQGK